MEGSAAASSTWELDLPVHYINRVEDLRDVPAGDLYVQPPMNFAAIDSVAIMGGTAYLMQITQEVGHDINVGLLSVLACLPAHLEVRFVWALPAEVWEQGTFNRKPIPQIASLSQPVHTGKESSRKHVETAEGALIAGGKSAEKDNAAKADVFGVSKQAIKQLVDRDVTLVERRVATCETQFKVSVPVTRDAPHTVPQPRMQDRPRATLRAASSMVRSAATTLRGSCLVRFLPSASPCSSQSSTLAFYKSAEGLQRFCRWRDGCIVACLCIENECALSLSGWSVQEAQVFRQPPAWARSGHLRPPVKALSGSCLGRRPLLRAAFTRQGTMSCAGGLPQPA